MAKALPPLQLCPRCGACSETEDILLVSIELTLSLAIHRCTFVCVFFHLWNAKESIDVCCSTEVTHFIKLCKKATIFPNALLLMQEKSSHTSYVHVHSFECEFYFTFKSSSCSCTKRTQWPLECLLNSTALCTAITEVFPKQPLLTYSIYIHMYISFFLNIHINVYIYIYMCRFFLQHFAYWHLHFYKLKTQLYKKCCFNDYILAVLKPEYINSKWSWRELQNIYTAGLNFQYT